MAERLQPLLRALNFARAAKDAAASVVLVQSMRSGAPELRRRASRLPDTGMLQIKPVREIRTSCSAPHAGLGLLLLSMQPRTAGRATNNARATGGQRCSVSLRVLQREHRL